MTVGVLALQGSFREHVRALRSLGVDAIEVRTPEQLGRSSGLVLPGGESTTIGKLLVSSGLLEPLGRFEGPLLGTCAGMIVLARHASDGIPGQQLLGLIDLDVRRNGFGRQASSFEADVTLDDGSAFPGVFIRAPRIERIGEGVEVVAQLGDEPVAVTNGTVTVTAFHPELTADTRLHEQFVRRGALV